MVITLKLVGVVAVLLGLCVLGLSVRILFHRSHRFPPTEVGSNSEMRRRGITCPKHDELRQWRGCSSARGGVGGGCAACQVAPISGADTQ